MKTEGRVEIGGISYAYLEAGDGPLVLFGHGTFGGKAAFRAQLEALSDRWRCVAIDWPGHGQSGYDPTGWDAQSLVAAVPKLLDAFGADTAILAGLSQGGAIFTRAALRYPNRVRALVCMSAGLTAPAPKTLAQLYRLARTLAQPDEHARRVEARPLALTLFHAPSFGSLRPGAVEAELDLMLTHPRGALHLLPGVPASYAPIADQVSQISCPVQVIWGMADTRPSLGAEIVARFSHAQLVEIAGAGHHVNTDAPERTTEAIRLFLDTATQKTS